MLLRNTIHLENLTAVQLKTILNSVEKHKSFVYQEARWTNSKTKTDIEILIEPRANGRAICSGCGKQAPGYDRLARRRFEFVPLWQITVYFVYAMRRVDCPQCGVTVEEVPWCDGKNPPDDDLPLVPGWLGEATFMEGCGRCVRHELAERVSFGKTCGFVGVGASESRTYRVDWGR